MLSSSITTHSSSANSAASRISGAPQDIPKLSKYQKQLLNQISNPQHSPLYCSNCKSDKDVVEDHAQGCMVCRGCGLVVSNYLISREEEHRNFQNDEGGEDKARASKASNNELLEGQLATSIARVPGQSGSLMRTQMKIQQTTEKIENRLKTAFSEINKWVDEFGAPSRAATTVQQIFKVLSENNKINSRNEKEALGACLYKGLKVVGHAVTLKEVCALLGVKEKKLNKMIMEIGKIESLKDLTIADSNSPKSYIESFASKLKLPTKILSFALDTAERVAEIGADAGKNPSTVAAACIVFASENHSDQKFRKTEIDVEEVSAITHATIRKAVNDFNKVKDKLLK
ncbi:hypothetical protein C9374_010484 [Naegleria lovaniensis]|uniref:General transcription factor TFIIB n=1 Tax=Naegleria lovaniensis TaxID=51637 RepID=A0AA88GFX2_NAELO|nr:uncharacterized protein C9374_010484 [Naegleria lovaniensis]KAG2374740.1 hypothetical protein C9374_010484 [Naegleria lovaniensis]